MSIHDIPQDKADLGLEVLVLPFVLSDLSFPLSLSHPAETEGEIKKRRLR